MAFDIKGFRTVDWMPNPSGEAGANLNVHKYVTNDDTSAVQTSGYFNSIWRRLKKGDHIDMTLDLDATVMRRNYIVTASTSSGVTVAAQNVA
ncbi:hypothetical protein [Rhizobium straminoryzae]|uniref:Uncharacterized protein n=1 Tax=Rhizobium straminoryzae TaxID=1387186 RepID=A0A549TD28_9HYPH|nr:hypothetical protein [Rhizobium straminoryzae]TRL39830.1 hypothetical protein FNA46_07805 [Rhizobium straminoryzae]